MEINKTILYFLTALETDQLSSNSVRAYKQDLNQFCLATNKNYLHELHFEDFQNYFVNMGHLKVTSLKRKRVVLHRFLKFCYRKKMCEEKLYENIDPIKSKKLNTPRDIFTKDEISQLFRYLSEEKQSYLLKIDQSYYEYLYYCSIRNTLLVNTLLYTGCRANEAVSIKKKDVNLLNNTITLLTKGKKYNQVPIHTELLKALKAYDQDIQLIKDPAHKAMIQSSYLFPSKSDSSTHLNTRTLHDFMKRLSVVMDKHIHAHLFRHTFASYCIAANMDISTISALISHSNPAITLSIYTHEIDSHNKQEQIKKLSFI